MDNLERFIQKNRSDFDKVEVPDKVWNNIERAIKPKKKK